MTNAARSVTLGLCLAAGLAAGGCSGTGGTATTPAEAPIGAPASSPTTEAPAAPEGPAAAAAPRPAAPTGTGTYDSNLGDYAIGVRAVMARYEPPVAVAVGSGFGFASRLTIELVEIAGRCGEYGAGISHRNAKTIALQIQRFGATAADAALRAGTYTIGSTTNGDVAFTRRVLSPACAPDAAAMPFDASTGCFDDLVVTSFDGKHVAGTYELRATDGRFVKGTFDADLCEATAPSAPALCD
jgi:hypothetical protein